MAIPNPATLILPDVTGAIMLRLRGDARLNSGGIVTNPAPRVWTIAPQVSPDWAMPTWAIIINPSGGPPNADWNEVGVHLQRFDVLCYGPGDSDAARKMNAFLLWRTMHPILCPPRAGASRAFILGSCRVMDVTPEGEPDVRVEEDTNWGRASCSYIVRYNEAPYPLIP